MDTRDLAKAYAHVGIGDRHPVPGAIVKELSQYILDHPDHGLDKDEVGILIALVWEKIQQTRKDTGDKASNEIWTLSRKLDKLYNSVKE